jgi:drug/metabolite transporter (DMT)-like permease
MSTPGPLDAHRFGRWPWSWPHTRRARGLLALLAGTVLIALMDALVKALSASLGTLQITWGRYLSSAILLFLVISPRASLARLRTRNLPLQLFRVVMLLAASGLFFGSLATMSLAEANAIAFTTPLLITVFAGLILGETVGARRWVAVVAGFAGVLLVVRPGSGIIGWAALLPLVSALCSALYHLTTRVLARSEDPASTLYFIALVGGAGLSLAVPFFWTPLTLPLALGLLVVGTLGTIGHFFIIRAFQLVPASTLSPFMYVYLVWAVVLGWLVFDDLPDLATLAGALVILGSGLYVWRHSGREAETPLQ